MTPISLDQFTPQQLRAYESLLQGLEIHPLVTLWGADGMGRSTVLTALHQRLGGKLLTIRDYVEATAGKHPLGTDEWLADLLIRALQDSEVVLVDDFHLAAAVPNHCYHPRSNYLDAAMEAAGTFAEQSGRTLVLAAKGRLPDALAKRFFPFGIREFSAADFAVIGRNVLGEAALQVDWSRIHRFSPRLTARDLTLCCRWISAVHEFEDEVDTDEGGSSAPETDADQDVDAEDEDEIDTDRVLDYLTSRHLTSNVDLTEVEDVGLPDLIGVDDVIASLEENIVFPMSDDPLAISLALQPKRGVLLAGPPGTGKTSVGRALAHRLGGKFFLIDGTAISGTNHFYHRVNEVFETAAHNAPAVVFIDDSDVIFESGREHGLYRYLLTKLDGLESRSAGRVCVMLTAMDVGNIPPALVRSGRIELWLEMRLPNAAARESILRKAMDGIEAFRELDVAEVVARSEEFSGADLKRLVLDAKLRYASEVRGGRPAPAIGRLLCDAADVIRRNRETYTEAETKAKSRRPDRPQWFSPMSDFHHAVDGD